MAINRLSANHDKTKILVMKHGNIKDELTFKIGDIEVKESANEELLGMWVSNNLQWSKHIEELEDDLSFRLFTIRKLEQSFPKSLFKNSRRCLQFSVEIWTSHLLSHQNK